MSTNKQPSEHSETSNEEIWPRRLNKLLIGIGVLAFGFIIADRLTHMFEADDLPAVTEVQHADETPIAALSQTDESTAVVSTSAEEPSVLADVVQEETAEDALSIDDVFGSSLVFVSASEPFYVITENRLRIDVGSELGGDFTLAGVTGDRVILSKDGEISSIALPDPDKR